VRHIKAQNWAMLHTHYTGVGHYFYYSGDPFRQSFSRSASAARAHFLSSRPLARIVLRSSNPGFTHVPFSFRRLRFHIVHGRGCVQCTDLLKPGTGNDRCGKYGDGVCLLTSRKLSCSVVKLPPRRPKDIICMQMGFFDLLCH
jgi:hypothetical protein